jgi:hypothetical protein
MSGGMDPRQYMSSEEKELEKLRAIENREQARAVEKAQLKKELLVLISSKKNVRNPQTRALLEKIAKML